MTTVTTIAYHYVRDPLPARFRNLGVLATGFFEAQLEYMTRHYRFVRMEECIAALRGRCELPPNAALLTFDDGYLDHYTNVLPILAQRSIRGVFFVSAKAVRGESVLDVNKLQFVLAAVPDLETLLADTFAHLDEHREAFGLESNDAYFRRLATPSRFDSREVRFLKRLLQRELPESVRGEIVDRLFRRYVTTDERSFARDLYMNREQLEDLADRGMVIGSHGDRHCHLTALSPEELEAELASSWRFMDEIGVRRQDRVFAYPYGSFDESCSSAVRRRGFAVAFSTRVALTGLTASNAFALERLDTHDLPHSAAAAVAGWTLAASAASGVSGQVMAP